MHSLKPKVELITVVQIRHEVMDHNGKIFGTNKKFQQPKAASEYWAECKTDEWQDKVYESYHDMKDKDYAIREARFEKYLRRSLPIFKRMLGNK